MATLPPSAEHSAIINCLRLVRRRLFTVRLLERLALGIAAGAVLALPVVGARLLLERYPFWSATVALLPALAGAWLWLKARRLAQPGIPERAVKLAAAVAWIGTALILAMALAPAHPWPLRLLSSIMVAAGALAGAITVRRVAPRAAAIFIDQQVGLRERVSTALEILEGPAPSSPVEAAFRDPLVGSAVQACAAVRGAKVGYSRVDKRVYPVAVAAALAAMGVTFLTPLQAVARQPRKQYVEVVKSTAKLADKLKEIEEQQDKKASDPSSKKLDPLRNALTDLRKGNMSPFEMETKINEAKGAMQKEKDEMDASDKAQAAMERMKALEQLQDAAKQEKDAQTADGKDPGDAAGKKSAADNAVKAAADAAASKVAGMNDSDKKDVAKGLKDAAQQAKDDPALQKSLDAAADAAEKGDTQKLSQSLSDAASRMGQQSADKQLTGQALKDAMDAIDQANAGGKSADEQQASGGQQNNGQQNGNQQQNGGGDQQQQANSGQGQNPDNQGQNGQNGDKNGQQPNGGQQANSGQQGNRAQQGSGSASGSSQQVAGNGSTNFHDPGGPGDKHDGGPIGKQGTFVKIYDENHIQYGTEIKKVTGQLNTQAPAAGTAEVMGPADKSDSTIKTYDSQLPAARQKAMDDLQTQNIPPEYRDVIRSYYEE